MSVANMAGDDIALQLGDLEERLFQLRDQAMVSGHSDGQSHVDLFSLSIALPITPPNNFYDAYGCDHQSEQESQDGSEGSFALGTPLPQKKSDLPEQDVFCPTEETVAPEDGDFSLNDAPPCHLDERVSKWIHAEGEEEDIEAEDMITPSPTTYHIHDPHMKDLHGHNCREAAYESGEVF
jgi:hypothetical protein